MIDAVATTPTPDTETAAPATGRALLLRWLPKRRLDLVLVAAIAVGAAVRLWGLGAQSLWYDEWLTAEAANGSLAHVRAYVAGQAGIPPAYFSLLWVWAHVVGGGDASLRMVSALAGIATIPVSYAAVRELGLSRRIAQLAALLVAVHPNLVWYSQEARPYSLLALLGTLSLLCAARVWRRGGRGDLLAWALVCAVAIAVHYFAAFLVAIEAVALLAARRPSWRDLRPAAVSAGVVLALLAPFAIKQFGHKDKHSWITDYSLATRLTDSGQSLLVGPTPTHHRAWMVAAALVALAGGLVAVRSDRTERRVVAALVATGLATVVLALAAAAAGIDFVLARYVIVLQVFGAVAVAIGLGARRVPRAVGLTAAAALCALSLFTVATGARDPDLQRADWRAVATAHDDGAHAAGATGGERLLVLNVHGYLGLPLQRYLDDARVLERGESVRVDEIDVVVALPSSRPCNGFIGLECLLIFLGAPLPEAAGDFVLEERIELDQFAIDRYRANHLERVTPRDVVPEMDLPRSLVLVTGGD